MKQQTLLVMNATIIVLLFACSASAWNASMHMVTGSIAYRILENESPRTVSVIKTLLEKILGTLTAGGTILRGTPKGQARDCHDVPVNGQ